MESKPPLVDGRGQLHWRRRLPARLGTGALWLGSLSLLGPLKVMVVVLVGGVLVPVVWWLDRDPPAGRDRRSHGGLSTPGLELPARLGLPEPVLFRARHGSSCTVHHDGEGRIVAIHLPDPAAAASPTRHDAHPVG